MQKKASLAPGSIYLIPFYLNVSKIKNSIHHIKTINLKLERKMTQDYEQRKRRFFRIKNYSHIFKSPNERRTNTATIQQFIL